MAHDLMLSWSPLFEVTVQGSINLRGKKTDDFTKSRSQFLGVHQLKLKEHLQFTYRSHGPTCLLPQYLGISMILGLKYLLMQELDIHESKWHNIFP